jgi:ribosomal protein S18 acetylase RimI-like enzyme
MKEETSVRRAAPQDASEIGRVHVACLHETYTGLMPVEWLATRTVEERTALWKNVIENPVARSTMAVCVAEQGGEVCGFGSCGPQRVEFVAEMGFKGEFSAIYVLRRFQRQRTGLKLMHGLAVALLENGIDTAALWCLRDNTGARRFYERLGGEFLLEREGPEIHAGQIEIVYGWRDIASLVKQLDAWSDASADSR